MSGSPVPIRCRLSPLASLSPAGSADRLEGRGWPDHRGHVAVEHLVQRRDLALEEQPAHQGPLNLAAGGAADRGRLDRKSTRLNSSHANISYAVFCLKKKR